MEIGKRIINIAIENGATLAGIASMKTLNLSPSHTIYRKLGDYKGIGTVNDGETLPDDQLFNWPDSARSVLLIGLSHPEERPEMDWFDGKGSPGNRFLIDIIRRTSLRIESDLKIQTQKLHYSVEKGGLFLKDAAVLAGLGCIGKNNMLVTPSHGPRVRLRALFIESDINSTGPIRFDPCADCKAFCRRVCPEHSMDDKAPIFKLTQFSEQLPGRDGAYNREGCNLRMEKDVAESSKKDNDKDLRIRYCRKCEFICPAGKNTKI